MLSFSNFFFILFSLNRGIQDENKDWLKIKKAKGVDNESDDNDEEEDEDEEESDIEMVGIDIMHNIDMDLF